MSSHVQSSILSNLSCQLESIGFIPPLESEYLAPHGTYFPLDSFRSISYYRSLLNGIESITDSYLYYFGFYGGGLGFGTDSLGSSIEEGLPLFRVGLKNLWDSGLLELGVSVYDP